MSVEKNNQTADTIRILMKKGMKAYHVYNVNGLVETLYEAQYDAETGEPCLRTDFKYVTDSSNVLAYKESIVEWDSAWDFDNL